MRALPLHRLRRADQFLAAQLTLALVALLLLGGVGLARGHGWLQRVVALCQEVVGNASSTGWTLLLLLPPLLIGLSLLLGVRSLLRQLCATRAVLNALRPARPLPPEWIPLVRRLGLEGRLRLVTDPRPLVFCAGLFRPSIWLTTGLLEVLDREALDAVLRHERHHLRRRDPLKLLLVRVLADALFYLPIVRELGRGYELHKELAADAAAARAPDDRRGLARALVQLLDRDHTPLDVVPASLEAGPMLLGGSPASTAARLGQLTGRPLPSSVLRRRSLLWTGLALLLFLAMAVFPLSPPARAANASSCTPPSGTAVVLHLETH